MEQFLRSSRALAAGLALAGLGLVALPATGDLYQWTDAGGVVRYTADLERVPAAARSEALRIERDPESGAALARRLHDGALVARAGAPAPVADGAAVDVAERAGPDGALDVAVQAAPARPGEPSGWAIELARTRLSGWLDPLRERNLLEVHRLYRSGLQLDGESWERLRLGFFPSPKDALAAAAVLEPVFPGAWVDRVTAEEVAASADGWGAEGPHHPSGAALFAVQLGAWPLGGGLRALTRLELLEHHRLYRTTVEADGEVWERLVLGDFPTLEAAEAVRRQLGPSHPDASVHPVGVGSPGLYGATSAAVSNP